MNFTVDELSSIMRAGGGLIVSTNISSDDLCSIARAGKSYNSKLTIQNSSNLTVDEMCSIARAHRGNVSFDL